MGLAPAITRVAVMITLAALIALLRVSDLVLLVPPVKGFPNPVVFFTIPGIALFRMPSV